MFILGSFKLQKFPGIPSMMAYPIAFSILAIFPLLLCYTVIRRRLRASKIPSTCQVPPSYPHKDPIFGLDLFWKIAQLRKFNQNIPAALERHKTYGFTYQALSLGQRAIHTVQPENLKAIYGSNWMDWGVCRLQGMEPFCGHGFITADGEDWKRFRTMIAPSLVEPSAVDLPAFDAGVEELVKKLPMEGETVDLAPMLDELVS